MLRSFSLFSAVSWRVLALLLVAAPCAAGPLQDGEQAMQQGDRATAQRLFTQVFEAGDPAGAFGLGVLYFQGEEAGDLEQSAHWFRIAAEAGHIGAQFNLGNAYVNGKGVQRDPAEAELWWRKAAYSGFSPARYNLGTLLLGHGGSLELREEGIAWYRLAAEQGFAEAEKALEKLGEPLDYGEIEADPSREPQRSEARLMTLPAKGVTIQLFSDHGPGSAGRFISRYNLWGRALQFRFLRDGKVWTAVVYGGYRDSKEAQAAITDLRPQLQKLKPWVRPLSGIRSAIEEVRRHLGVAAVTD